MVLGILALALITVSEPYEFEIDRGPILEVKAGSAVTDAADKSSLATGARLGYSFANFSDRFITGEIEFTFQYYKIDGISGNNPYRKKYSGDAFISFYENYNPFAFRASLGGGIERRLSKNNPQASYRFGLGHYWNSDFGVFADMLGRYIFRDNDNSFGLELSIATQYIF